MELRRLLYVHAIYTGLRGELTDSLLLAFVSTL